MLYISLAILILSLISALCLSGRHYIHMFQLNSYKPGVQLEWIRKNSRKHFIIAAVSAVPSAFGFFGLRDAFSPLPVFLTAAALVIYSAAFFSKGENKVPLKYTMRVKRLILSCALLTAAAGAACWLLYSKGLFWNFAGLYLLLFPYMILLANLINRPAELLISRHYIKDAARLIRECPGLLVIGITGSFGKTSVKYFLEKLLSVRYNVLKTPGNINTTLGVVRVIREQLKPTHEIFLCEMGARNPGDIREICELVSPRMGVITSVGPMHLESFGTLERIVATKFELADSLPQDGGLYLNMDSEPVAKNAGSRGYISYGIDDRSGYYADDITVGRDGSEFTAHSPSGESERYKTALIGRHNVLNLMGAIAVASSLGIPLRELRAPIRRLESVPHRLQLINKGDYSIIDDAYNSNPSGARAALEALSMAEGMKILVTPGMVELGGSEYELNKELGAQAAGVCDFVALVGAKRTAPIRGGLIESGFPSDRIYVASTLGEAMEAVRKVDSGGRRKTILLENDLPDNY